MNYSIYFNILRKIHENRLIWQNETPTWTSSNIYSRSTIEWMKMDIKDVIINALVD